MSNDAAKRKVAMLGVSGLLLVVIGTAVTVGVTSNPSGEVSSSMKAIDSVCAPTDYKEACVKSLEDSDSSDPKELMKVGLNSTMKHILKAAGKSHTLQEVEKDPMAKQALDICRRLLDYSMDELNTSLDRLGNIDITKIDDAFEDLNIWLSSVSTFQETCLDGFENVTSEAGEKMRVALNTSMELTSNAIAMVTEISSIMGNLSIPVLQKSNDHRRRLLQKIPLEPDREVLGTTKHRLLTVTSRKAEGGVKPHAIPLEPDTEVPGSVGPTKHKLLQKRAIPLEPDIKVPGSAGPTKHKLLQKHAIPLEPDGKVPGSVVPAKHKLLQKHAIPLEPDSKVPGTAGPIKHKLLQKHVIPLEPDGAVPYELGPKKKTSLGIPLEPNNAVPYELGPKKQLSLGIPLDPVSVTKLKPRSIPLEPDTLVPGSTKQKPRVIPLDPDGKLPNWVGLTKRKLLASTSLKADLVVAKDGSGKYTTITAALRDIPLKSKEPFVLHVKAGVYKEKVTFDKKMTNLVLVGDGPTKTKITNNKNFAAGVKTWDTSTVTVLGNDFFAKDIGFENTAGASGHQAVALLVKSEKAVVFNCQMDGYQDTLYVPALRQFYRDCVITGTIDFIFGDAAAIFQNCKMLIRKPMPNQQCIVTAQGRKESRARTGIVLQGCTITGDSTYMAAKDQFKSYLGRPWKKFARTIVMQSTIDGIIEPEGWLPWAGDFALNTLYYSEYKNKGAGASTAHRVKWKGVRHLSPAQIMSYTPKRFLIDDTWITARGIPYNPGMLA